MRRDILIGTFIGIAVVALALLLVVSSNAAPLVPPIIDYTKTPPLTTFMSVLETPAPESWGSVVEDFPSIDPQPGSTNWWQTWNPGTLEGDLVFVAVFVNSPGYTAWTTAEKNYIMSEIESGGSYMESEADRYGATLTTDLVEQYTYSCSTDPHQGHSQWWTCAWEIIDYTGSWGDTGTLSPPRILNTWSADKVVIVFLYQNTVFGPPPESMEYIGWSSGTAYPFQVMTKYVTGWGNSEVYYMHESYHNFDAPDQYYAWFVKSCFDTTDKHGPWGYQNWNSQMGVSLDPNNLELQYRKGCPPHVDSTMSGELSHSLDPWGAAHVGWATPEPQYWPRWNGATIKYQFTAVEPQMIENTSFEDTEDGWYSSIPNHTPTDGDKMFGDYSLLLWGNVSSGKSYRLTDLVGVEGSTGYRFSEWVRKSDAPTAGKGAMLLQWFDSSQSYISQSLKYFDAGEHEWKYYENDVTSPASAAYVRIFAVYLTSDMWNSPFEMFIDGVSFTKN